MILVISFALNECGKEIIYLTALIRLSANAEPSKVLIAVIYFSFKLLHNSLRYYLLLLDKV